MTERQAIETGNLRPHCDNCGHTGEPVQPENMRAEIGKPCPKCGTVMVTAEDCDELEKMLAGVEAINAIAKLLDLPMEGPRAHVRHRTGRNGTEILGIIRDDE